jgi:predicted GNAT family N-acyltransferase
LNDGSIETRAPQTDKEWADYYELRWRILRQPWQQSGPDRDPTDDTAIHRMVCTGDGEVLAVGRLHRVDDNTGQIRFMAVAKGRERQGYGGRLLAALEQAARDLPVDTLILQAREAAVPFYRHHGYELVEKTFLLFGEIQHYLMQKRC